jgi:hypothetical protein
MKTKLIATLMLAGSSLFAGPRVFFGVNVGVPIAPAPVVVAPAPMVGYAAPGPGYLWVNGGYTFVGGRRVWNAGYWRGPAVGARYGYRGFRR